MQDVQFEPLNDQVLIKLDVKKRSLLAVGDRNHILPSGVVLAVGRGVFVPGTGFVEPQVKAGDHVAVSMDGLWTRLPLSEDKEEIFVSVSESLILGRIENALPEGPWYKAADDISPNIVRKGN